MRELTEIIRSEDQRTAPITLSGVDVSFESRSLAIRLPFFGFVWNRPRAIIIERGGWTERMEIPDPTRRALWMLLGAVLVAKVLLSNTMVGEEGPQ